MRTAILFAIALAAPATAQTPMSAAAFEAYTTGKTLTYGTADGPYGAEQYRDGRRVLWSFLDGECIEGTWYQSGPDICFAYQDWPAPQCWRFFTKAGGLSAQFVSDQPGDPLIEVSQSPEPLYCLGPKVGS